MCRFLASDLIGDLCFRPRRSIRLASVLISPISIIFFRTLPTKGAETWHSVATARSLLLESFNKQLNTLSLEDFLVLRRARLPNL